MKYVYMLQSFQNPAQRYIGITENLDRLNPSWKSATKDTAKELAAADIIDIL